MALDGSVFPIGMAGCGKGVRRGQKEGQYNHRYRSERGLALQTFFIFSYRTREVCSQWVQELETAPKLETISEFG